MNDVREARWRREVEEIALMRMAVHIAENRRRRAGDQ